MDQWACSHPFYFCTSCKTLRWGALYLERRTAPCVSETARSRHKRRGGWYTETYFPTVTGIPKRLSSRSKPCVEFPCYCWRYKRETLASELTKGQKKNSSRGHVSPLDFNNEYMLRHIVQQTGNALIDDCNVSWERVLIVLNVAHLYWN